MIDWLTVEVPDSVGVPINDGHVCRVRPDGSLDWSSACRKSVEGSWSSNMTFRAVAADYVDEHQDRASWELSAAAGSSLRRSGLEISGNPAKFLNGHNLFGSDDPDDLLQAVVQKALPAIYPGLSVAPLFDFSTAKISRIDLTYSWLVDRAEDVVPFLRAMEERVWCPFRGKGVMNDIGTLYYGFTKKGKRAKDWQLKLYSKGLDVSAHPLPKPAYEVPGLLDEVNRTIRAELTLRTAELKRLGLSTVGEWTPAKVGETWRTYVDKLDFGEAAVNLDTVDLSRLGLSSRSMFALAAWKAGNDLRASMSTSAFYRLRKTLKDKTGFDIGIAPPKSNVVPLRRVVSASPAQRPHWANHLTEALARVA